VYHYREFWLLPCKRGRGHRIWMSEEGEGGSIGERYGAVVLYRNFSFSLSPVGSVCSLLVVM